MACHAKSVTGSVYCKKHKHIKLSEAEKKWREALPRITAPPTTERYPPLFDILEAEQGTDDPTILGTRWEKPIREKIVAMHELGIFHGDLHIQNIVVIDNEPYFIDFEHTTKIKDINKKKLKWFVEFLELEEYGYPKTIEGIIARENEMPFVQ